MTVVHGPRLAVPEVASSLRTILTSVVVLFFAFLTLYLVIFEQTTVSGGNMFLHEFMHDGRHILSGPCH
ncbi:MAG: CbtB domain-containing protein [Mycobacteriaceae bacterium]